MKIKFIQKIIDKLRNKVPYHKHINELAPRILTLYKVKSEINTLIIGSSHAQLGYIADKKEFNIGLSWQDLYTSYELYKKYSSQKINNVILFYSVFSAGNQRLYTKTYNVSALYKVIAGIEYQDKNLAGEKGLYKLEKPYAKQFKKFKEKFVIDKNYRGNHSIYNKPNAPINKAMIHFKDNIRNNNQTKYVEKIYNLTKEYHANLFIVIPPATVAYKALLPDSKYVFRDLYALAEKLPLNIINLYDSEAFQDEDFLDYDHLNKNGAIKLTKIVKEYMSETRMGVESNPPNGV